jgi:hypothetical protein
MPRTIRERPRYAFLVSLGLVALLALGVAAGFVLASGLDTEDPGPSATEVRQAQRIRALRLELSQARGELVAARDRLKDAAAAAGRQRARAAGSRRRAELLERRNQALQDQLEEAQQAQPE